MARQGSALQKAISGDKVTDKQAQGALSQAVGKIANLSKRAQQSKEAMVETGSMVVHTAETQGSLFLSSLAEGYFGADKLKVGPVDLRAPVGLLAQGYGLYEAMSGKGSAGGHSLALGNGVMGSWLASVAVSAGKTLAEKKGGGEADASTPQVQQSTVVTPAIQGPVDIPDPLLQGSMREVLLTPEPQTVVVQGYDDELEGHRRRKRPRRRGPRRRPNRFVRPDNDPVFEDDDE